MRKRSGAVAGGTGSHRCETSPSGRLDTEDLVDRGLREVVVALRGGHDEVADERDLVAECCIHEIVALVDAVHDDECRNATGPLGSE